MEKLDSYDKRRYDSLTDYIVQAILAYNEPVVIGEDLLRQILREELGENEKIIQVPAAHIQEHESREENIQEAYPEETSLQQERTKTEKEPESKVCPEKVRETQEIRQEPGMDDTTIAFMKELGIM